MKVLSGALTILSGLDLEFDLDDPGQQEDNEKEKKVNPLVHSTRMNDLSKLDDLVQQALLFG